MDAVNQNTQQQDNSMTVQWSPVRTAICQNQLQQREDQNAQITADLCKINDAMQSVNLITWILAVSSQRVVIYISSDDYVIRQTIMHFIKELYIWWITLWFVLREKRHSTEISQQTAGEQQEKLELEGEFGRDRAKDLSNGEFIVQFSLVHDRWMIWNNKCLDRIQADQCLSLLTVYQSLRSPATPLGIFFFKKK